MKSDLPIIASKRFKIPLAILFKVAYDYGEVRKHPTNKRNAFDHFVNTGNCPQFVIDFALDLLAGRVKYTFKRTEL